MRVLTVGAHPDDLEIACGGTIALLAKRGDDVVMAHVTNGSKGTFTQAPAAISEVRRAEAAHAADLAGASAATLGVDDGEVDASNRDQRATMVDLVRKARPDLVITHHPDDYHPDHNATSRLVFDCSFLATLPNLEGATPHLAAIPPIYYMETAAGLGFHPTEFVDVGDVLETKVKMLEAHESQLTWIEEHHGTDMVEQLRATARFRGQQCGATYAEGFVPCVKWMRGTTRRLLP